MRMEQVFMIGLREESTYPYVIIRVTNTRNSWCPFFSVVYICNGEQQEGQGLAS